MIRILLAGMLMLASHAAYAADTCPAVRSQLSAPDTATRIAAVACNENMMWYRPFIDTDGRMASTTVMEAESSVLGDGVSEAWRRVALYWQDSGLLWQMSGFAGAGECGYAVRDRSASPSCRAFVVDNPWSAAFISYVMRRAGVPGFRASASHIDYVRDAYQRADSSPFLYLDPATAKPAMGDLLCYVRIPGRTYGYEGLIAAVGSGNGGLNMHCDVIVAVNPNNDGKAYLIGGNVQQGVTMRLLRVNRNGNFWALPQRAGVDPLCSPDSEASCNFNRQDWSVLLKLKSPSALALLPPAVNAIQQSPLIPAQPAQQCCINCVVGSGIPRCPPGTNP
ncbi:MAG: DUF2272 domain-containing protein [Luteimonas sp.]